MLRSAMFCNANDVIDEPTAPRVSGRPYVVLGDISPSTGQRAAGVDATDMLQDRRYCQSYPQRGPLEMEAPSQPESSRGKETRTPRKL